MPIIVRVMNGLPYLIWSVSKLHCNSSISFVDLPFFTFHCTWLTVSFFSLVRGSHNCWDHPLHCTLPHLVPHAEKKNLTIKEQVLSSFVGLFHKICTNLINYTKVFIIIYVYILILKGFIIRLPIHLHQFSNWLI